MPLVCATPPCKNSAVTLKRPARLVGDALVSANAAGATGVRLLRAASAFYGDDRRRCRRLPPPEI